MNKPSESQTPPPGVASSTAPAPSKPPLLSSKARLRLLLAICVAPVVASYLAYYVMPPSNRTNYGELIEPQRAVPTLQAVSLLVGKETGEMVEAEGRRVVKALPEDALDPFRSLRGRWILLAVDGQGCGSERCAEKLFFSRQTHAAMGRERGRMARALILTDDTALDARLPAAHPDLNVFRVAPERLLELLPVPADGQVTDYLYLIDPLHNLMMRFPKDPDPAKVRRDLQKLLRASRIG